MTIDRCFANERYACANIVTLERDIFVLYRRRSLPFDQMLETSASCLFSRALRAQLIQDSSVFMKNIIS